MTPVHLAGPRLALLEVEPEDTAALLAITPAGEHRLIG